MAYVDTFGLGLEVVAGGVSGFGLGAGLTAAGIAGLGAGALGSGAGEAGDAFTNAAGRPGFTNLGSYNDAITNGASANTSPAGTQYGNQSVYNQNYQAAINGGVNPSQAAQYAQISSGGYTPGGAGGFGGAAPSGLGGNIAGETTSALNAANGVTSLAPVVVNGGAPSALGTLGAVGAVGGGAAALGSLGSSPGVTPGMTSSPSMDQQYNGSAEGGSSSVGGTAAPSTASSPVGINPSTLGALGNVAGAAGSIIKGASGGTSTQAPNPGDVAGGILQDEINFAPQVYNTTAQYAPQYNQLQNQLLTSAANNVTSTNSANALTLQGTQNQLNASQAQGNQSLLQNYGAGTVSAYQAANPQLQALQGQLTGLAQSAPSPVGQINGAGQWGAGYNTQVAQTLNNAQVSPSQIQSQSIAPNQTVSQGQNQTLSQLNGTAQQQLALGTSVSPQEASTVANEVLSNYNAQGRANDPTAIAGLATGLDTYGQQLLTQREGAASNAAGLTTAQNQLGVSAGTANLAASQQSQLANQATNLSAQQSNQSNSLAAQQSNQNAALGGLGLQYEGLASSQAQGLQAAQSNQQAQLSNANYDANLLTSAAGLAQSTAAPAMNSLLTQSNGLTDASTTTQQGGTSTGQASALSGMYNPFNSSAYNSAYQAQANANTTNATTNAGYISGGLSLLGSLNSAAGNAGGYSNLFSGLFG